MKKPFKIALFSIAAVFLLSIFLVIPTVIYIRSISPNKLSDLPKSGLYVCEGEDFRLEIDFGQEGDEGKQAPIGAKSVTLFFGGKEYALVCYEMGGHGTIFVPTAPADILCFESEEEAELFVRFDTHKYRVEEGSFTLCDIYPTERNEAGCFHEGMDLVFKRKP